MSDDDPNRLKGSSCTATLDFAARTLTSEHRGMFRSKPLASDPHGLYCAVDPTAFAQRVQEVVEIPQPTPDSTEQPTADAVTTTEPDTEHDADGQAARKPDGKVTKAVDGVLDAFSRFN